MIRDQDKYHQIVNSELCLVVDHVISTMSVREPFIYVLADFVR